MLFPFQSNAGTGRDDGKIENVVDGTNGKMSHQHKKGVKQEVLSAAARTLN